MLHLSIFEHCVVVCGGESLFPSCFRVYMTASQALELQEFVFASPYLFPATAMSVLCNVQDVLQKYMFVSKKQRTLTPFL
jgi:hypothetical protein